MNEEGCLVCADPAGWWIKELDPCTVVMQCFLLSRLLESDSDKTFCKTGTTVGRRRVTAFEI